MHEAGLCWRNTRPKHYGADPNRLPTYRIQKRLGLIEAAWTVRQISPDTGLKVCVAISEDNPGGDSERGRLLGEGRRSNHCSERRERSAQRRTRPEKPGAFGDDPVLLIVTNHCLEAPVSSPVYARCAPRVAALLTSPTPASARPLPYSLTVWFYRPLTLI